MSEAEKRRPVLLVLASTYPRWQDDPEPGFVHELSRRLTDRFRVIVLGPHAPGAKPRELLDGVDVIRYRYAPERLETLVNDGGIVTNLKLHRWKLLLVPGFVLLQAWWAWRLCRRERVDVIHAHWLIPQGVIAAWLGKPFLVTSHGADLFALRSGPLNALKRFVLRKAQAASVVSRAMHEAVVELGSDPAKVSVVPMGVDMEGRFVPDDAVPRSRSELLFVGRLVEKKGLRYLLEALPRVRRERPDVTLSVVGFGPDETFLKAKVRELGLQDVVRFRGAVTQKDLPDMYRQAALFIAPFVKADSGDQEGLGLVLVEAIGCGCPVLAGDVPAVRDVIDETWCIDVRETEKFAARILQMLNDPASTAVQVHMTREVLKKRLGWEHVAFTYANLLEGSVARC